MSTSPSPSPAPADLDVPKLAVGRRFRSHKAQRVKEAGILGIMGSSLLFSVLITFSIIAVLGMETTRFFQQEEVSVGEFFGQTQWNPLLGSEKHFGIWPLVSGTFQVAGIALLVAVPLGLITAVYLSEYANPKVRMFLKPALEILAGIPTVVYGFFALVLLTPSLKKLDESFGSYNAMSAGIAVGVLILPIVSSLSEDALRAVPKALREGSYGLGGTKFDTAVKIVFPAALSGIVSAVLLAGTRAIGETMIVALAAGSRPTLTLDPREEIQTMTGFMVQMALGDVSNFGVEYYSMYAVAGTLFVLTFTFAIVGALIRKRFREAYQ